MSTKTKAQLQYEEARFALETLERQGFEAMLAGGCVRDRLMGRDPKDYDIATTARPDAVTKAFTGEGRQVVPTGIDHGTVTLVMPQGPIEITTLRKDVETDGRRAKVVFDGATFEEDAARRDFSINAIFEDLRGQIVDYFDGRKALKDRRLAFVGDPRQRIQEDYLRILRFFRFWARLQFEPEAHAIEAISQECKGLMQVSQERITSELVQMFREDVVLEPMRAMIKTGVLATVFPGLIGKTLRPELTEELRRVNPDHDFRSLARLASLFFEQKSVEADEPGQDEARWMQDLAAKMRLSNADIRSVTWLVGGWAMLEGVGDLESDRMAFLDHCENSAGPLSWERFFRPTWSQFARHTRHRNAVRVMAQIQALDVCETTKGWLRRTKLPLTGHDVMQVTGKASGSELGQLMGRLLVAFRDGQWHSREEGLDWLKSHSARP